MTVMHEEPCSCSSFDVGIFVTFRISIGSLLVLLLTACAGSSPGDSSGNLRFTDVICLPEVTGGQTIVEGSLVTCTFHVAGPPGRAVTLRCEDGAGNELDCGSSSRTQLQPFGASPLPLDDGFFTISTDGLAGTTAVVVWVADDGEEEARHRFEAQVVADDGLNEPPGIELDCGGDTDGSVDIKAGNELVCTLRFIDPDPDLLTWSYEIAQGGTPTSEPTPFGGAATAPFEAEWRWITAPSESGMAWTFRFKVMDGAAPEVTRDLIVNVE